MLEMKNVVYSYRQSKKEKKQIFVNANYTFEKGKVYTLFGSSGAGKTTCLALLGGLEKPESGEILLDGKNIKEIGYNKLRREYVSYVFQDYHLFPYMNAIENLLVVAKNVKKKKDRTKQCQEILEKLGIEKKDQNRIVTQLSGGQQQRVAIGRALIANSDYILADEPTGNLDENNTKKIMDILLSLAHEQGKCVIVVTHSSYVKDMSDICYSINQENKDENI